MNNNRKKILITIGVLLAITLLIGASYAYYIFTISQSGSNIVNTDCFRVTFTDGNAISLGDAIPLTDEEAEELTPYTFTIKNVCNRDIDYNINIETLNDTTMDLDAIKYQLFNDDYDYMDSLGSMLNNDPSTFINNNVSNSKTIQSNYLIPNEEVTYNLRLWIGEEATYEQSANKIFSSKVVISSVLRYENPPGAILAKGKVFNARIKSLFGIDDNTLNGKSECENDSLWEYFGVECKLKHPLTVITGMTDPTVNTGFYESNQKFISKIQVTDTMPSNDKETIVVSDESSKDEILAWLEYDEEAGEETIMIYSPSQIYMNRDSSYAFSNLDTLETLDLSSFDFSLVENMEGIFYNLGASRNDFEPDSYLDLGENFKTPNLKKVRAAFLNTYVTSVGNINKINTSKVTDMSHIFDSSSGVTTSIDFNIVDTSKVKNMSWMFANTEPNLNGLDTSNVTNMEGMFAFAATTTLDVSNLNTSNVTNMKLMFAEATEQFGPNILMENIIGLDTFDTSKVTNMSGMFRYDVNIVSLDISHFDTSNVTDMSNMFENMSKLQSLDTSHLNTSKVTNMSRMFYKLLKLQSLDVSNLNTSNVTNMSSMFEMLGYDESGRSLSLNVSNFDTSNVTDMSHMFQEATVLHELDISHFDTSKVTNMSGMFSELENVSNIDISHFNTSNVTDMSHMFENMSELLSLDTSHLNTSNVTNMSDMFSGLSKIASIDISNFNTSKVTNMSGMFSGMSDLTNLDASNFNTSNVTDMSYMFNRMSDLTNLNISSFNTSNVTDMSNMFTAMSNLTNLDVSSFDTSNVTNMEEMFYRMSNIKTIYVGNNFNTSNVTISNDMFYSDTKLVGGAGTRYNSSHKDAEYARVDDPTNGKPGYFTLKTN